MSNQIAVKSNKCSAHKKDGTPCGNFARKSSTVCNYHGGKAPQVRNAARQRLLAAADPVMAELVKLALDAKSDSDPQMRLIRLKAMADVLDRVPELSKRKVTAIEREEDDPEAVRERAEELQRIVDEGVARMRRRQADALGTQLLSVDGRPV